MRAIFLLVGSLALFLGACSSKGCGHAPAPLNKEWLTGKWENVSTALFLTSYQFDTDGAVTMTFKGIKQPVKGRYTWTGDRSIEVEYPSDADVRREYEAAAKEYKDDVKKRIETKKLNDRAGPPMLGMVPDQMPDKESLRVGITDPKYLSLVRNDSTTFNFQKAQ